MAIRVAIRSVLERITLAHVAAHVRGSGGVLDTPGAWDWR